MKSTYTSKPRLDLSSPFTTSEALARLQHALNECQADYQFTPSPDDFAALQFLKIRQWEDGVKDAISIVNHRMDMLRAMNNPPMTFVPKAAFAALEDVSMLLESMLSRGQYKSRDTVMDAVKHGADEADGSR